MLSGGAFVVGGCFDKVDVDVEKLDVDFNVVIDEKVGIKVFVVVVVVDVVVVDELTIGVAVVEDVEVVVKVFGVVVVVVVVVDEAVVGVKIFKKIHCTKS